MSKGSQSVEATAPCKQSVLVDLDGTLAFYSGWQGVMHIGDPLPGAVQFTHDLGKFARVIVFTTRCKAFLPKDAGPEGKPEQGRDKPAELAIIVRAWLDRHGFHYDEVYVEQGKPFAAAIVDDRAVECEPQRWGSAAYAAALRRCLELCGISLAPSSQAPVQSGHGPVPSSQAPTPSASGGVSAPPYAEDT